MTYLRPENVGRRDAAKAEAMLLHAAATSQNKSLTSAVAAFTALTPGMRSALVAAIEVIDGAPLIADVESLVEDRLRMIAPRGKAALARQQLEGWWWPRICAALQAETPETIPIIEVEQALDDIRDSLKRDALPFDMEHLDPPQAELDLLEEMRFVRQLRGIGLSPSRIQFAKRDFYRSSAQRSQWARQNLLFDGEVGRFEKTLVEEWQPRFEQMCDSLTEDCGEATLHDAGRKLYAWVENDARFPIRAEVRRFLNVGSYHILADDLRVGWHRDYLQLHDEPHEGGSNG